jgi:hypothetical protein
MPSIRLHFKAPKVALSTESDDPMYPTEQLELVHKELDRQRAAIAARRTSMHTRAAVLVTAAGNLATLQTTSLANGWQFISVGLSVASAVFGLWAMRPVEGDDSDPADIFNNYLTNSAYSIERKIVKENLAALDGEMTSLSKIARTITTGYVILFATWVSMIIIAGLIALKDI